MMSHIRSLHTFVHTDPRGSRNVLLKQLSPPSIGHARVTTPSVLPLCSTSDQSPGRLPTVFCQRLYPCRTGLSIDTCNSTPFRSSCTPVDASPPVITNDVSKSTSFPTLSSPPGPSSYLDSFSYPTTEGAVINNGDTEYYSTRTSRSSNLDMFLYKPKP